jgi:hypothetical protein
METNWITILGAIGAHAWAGQTGMWAIPALLPRSARARERVLFRNEIAHAKIKLAKREQAIARAAIAARSVKLDTRQSKIDLMQASVQRTRDNQAKRDAERAEIARLARDKEVRLRAQKLAMNSASVSGTRSGFDRLYNSTRR